MLEEQKWDVELRTHERAEDPTAHRILVDALRVMFPRPVAHERTFERPLLDDQHLDSRLAKFEGKGTSLEGVIRSSRTRRVCLGVGIPVSFFVPSVDSPSL